jgi:hypothetical protein
MKGKSGVLARLAGVALVGLGLLSGCDATGPIVGPDQPLRYRVTVRPKELTLRVGQSAQLVAVVLVETGGHGGLRWVVVNEDVLTVSDGLVTCLRAGRGVVFVIATGSEGRPDAPPAGDTAIVSCIVDGPAPEPTPTPTPTPDPGQSVSIEVSPSNVSFEHVIGSSPCPQQAGGFEVRNTGTQQVSLRITSGNGAIGVNPTERTVAPGAALSVALSFNCATQQSFSTDVTVTATAGASSDTRRVRVNASIR